MEVPEFRITTRRSNIVVNNVWDLDYTISATLLPQHKPTKHKKLLISTCTRAPLHEIVDQRFDRCPLKNNRVVRVSIVMRLAQDVPKDARQITFGIPGWIWNSQCLGFTRFPFHHLMHEQHSLYEQALLLSCHLKDSMPDPFRFRRDPRQQPPFGEEGALAEACKPLAIALVDGWLV